MKLHSRLIVWALPLCAALVWAASAKEITVDVATGTPVMLANQKETAFLRVAMTGFERPDSAKRPAVNVVFVIDKSGSMGGDKIDYAKQAIRSAIGRLRNSDIVSVVAYDSNVQVLVPATKLTDRESVLDAVDALNADGSTALFAGVSKGAGELRKFMEHGLVNRVVLLSDGLANVGPSSPGELADLGQSLGRDGIAVSTIGLGLDYNEDLMTRLASASDGNHMFAERPSDLEEAFGREFGDVLTVVAQRVNIRIECADGIRPVRVFGREANISGQNVSLSMNQLYSEQMKYVLLEVEVAASEVGTERKVANVYVDYLNMATQAYANVRQSVAVSFTDSPDRVREATNNEVMAAAELQIATEQYKLATRLRDEGKMEEAQQLLFSNSNRLQESAEQFDSDELRGFASSNSIAAENLDEESYKRQRKIMREEQFKNIKQQQK